MSESPTQERIHRQMTIEEIFSRFPQKSQRLAQAMSNAGLQCVGCHAATWETLEAGMLSHGMSQQRVDELIGILNGILDEMVDLDTIALTPRAAEKYLEILDEEGKQGWGLRFADKAAGCNGFEYILDFSEDSDDEDEVFLSHGVEIHVKKNLVKRLMGSQIDWVTGLQGAGFKVSNPNAKSSCGCGTSHGY